nr:orf276 [Zancudomyces culisetae]AAW49508.1 orf276 [Zancudomyces culisetae]
KIIIFNTILPNIIKNRSINKNSILLPNKDYLEKFLVGLLDGDGCITVFHDKSNNYLRIKILIALLNNELNLYMFNLLKKKLEMGRISIERKDKYVIYYIESKKDIYKTLKILDKYPLLTSRKICQLEYFKKFLENRNIDNYLNINKANIKYFKQEDIINKFNKNFLLPDYFNGWLSGFIEAEGNFKLILYKTGGIKSRQFQIGQNNDKYLLLAIKTYLNSFHKIYIDKDSNPLHYRISIGGEIANNNLLKHFKENPLLGNKLLSYNIWYNSFKVKN